MGVMTRDMQKKLFPDPPKTARTYRSKSGKKSYAGTRFLKQTQNLVCID